jgi:hypothetical protein
MNYGGLKMNKITTEQVEQWEISSLLDALCSNALELNDEFLKRYAGDGVRKQLMRVPEEDRAFHLDGVVSEDNCFFNGSPAENCSDDIWLDVAELEVQFEGDPNEYFENPDDFYIQKDSDLAYYYVGYGLTVNVDIEELKSNIDDYLTD